MNLWTHKPWTNKDSSEWYLILEDKSKEGSIHALDEKQTKQYDYVPLIITSIQTTPFSSNYGDRHNDNTPAHIFLRQ